MSLTLNIPRYVDTFEEEEPVDLESVSNELEALKGRSQRQIKPFKDL